MTEAEKFLWQHLRGKQLNNVQFRRQMILGPYIVDFVCLSARLIIECDGGQHQEALDCDAKRDHYFTQQGYTVLRFWNNEVFENIDGVLEQIVGCLIQ